MLTKNRTSGFSLIELVITVTVLAILTLAAVPMVQVSVKRQKEQQLHEALRTMREAIDQFHREALAGGQQPGTTNAQQEQAARNPPNNQRPTGNPLADPRVRVFVSDQTIFTVDNMDRYPPDLQTLVKVVDVLPLVLPAQLQGGVGITAAGILERSQNSAIPKTKVYL